MYVDHQAIGIGKFRDGVILHPGHVQHYTHHVRAVLRHAHRLQAAVGRNPDRLVQEFIAQPGVFDIKVDAIRIRDTGGLILHPAPEFDDHLGAVVRVRDAHAAYFHGFRTRFGRGICGRGRVIGRPVYVDYQAIGIGKFRDGVILHLGHVQHYTHYVRAVLRHAHRLQAAVGRNPDGLVQEFIAQPGVFDIKVDAIRIRDTGGLILHPASEFDDHLGAVARVGDTHAAHFHFLCRRRSARHGAAGSPVRGTQRAQVLRVLGRRALLCAGWRANPKDGCQEDG